MNTTVIMNYCMMSMQRGLLAFAELFAVLIGKLLPMIILLIMGLSLVVLI